MHWLQTVSQILNSNTSDLRALAELAGEDPRTFYRHTILDNVDISGQDLTGMEFKGFDFYTVTYDHKTILPEPPIIDQHIQETAEQEATKLLRENKPLPRSIGENVRHLRINSPGGNEGREFYNTSLLQTCPWLQSLTLDSTQVTDLSPLSMLSHLRSLELYDVQISDISHLNNLTNLQRLDLANTLVSGISHLKHLTNLQWLDLGYTQVSDISHLKNLTNLQELYLNGTQVSDISHLKNLTNLQTLDLDKTQVSDWSPVAHVAIVSGRPEGWEAAT